MTRHVILIFLITALLLLMTSACTPNAEPLTEIVDDPAAVLTANAIEVQTLSAGLQQGVTQQVGTIAAVVTQTSQQAAQNANTPQPLNSTQIQLTQSATQRQSTVFTYKATSVKTGTTQTQVATQTPTSTTGQQSGWTGTWTAYLQQSNDTYLSGSMTVAIVNNQVQGSANLGGSTMTVTGNLPDTASTIYGTYSVSGSSGAFAWLKIDENSFKGNIDNTQAFCATRPGGIMPDPCGYFFPQ